MNATNRRMSFGYTGYGPDQEADVLEALCEGYVQANVVMIRADPDRFPCCTGCGGYQYEEPSNCRVRNWETGVAVDPDCQHVRGAVVLHKMGVGTCIDLACMAAALLRVKDEKEARVVIEHDLGPNDEWQPGKYHAVVMLDDGSIVDPSAEAPLAIGGRRSQQRRGEQQTSCGCKGAH
jgi:hypothetical protein